MYNFFYFLIASTSILFALNNLFGLNNLYYQITGFTNTTISPVHTDNKSNLDINHNKNLKIETKDEDIAKLNQEILELKNKVDSLESQNSLNKIEPVKIEKIEPIKMESVTLEPIKIKSIEQKNTQAETIDINILEQQIYQKINEYRTQNHLKPVLLDPRLSKIAKDKSKSMAANSSIYGNDDLEIRGKEIQKFIIYKELKEALGYNYGYANPSQAMINNWTKDPNFITMFQGDYEMTGVGVEVNWRGEYYFTQIFVSPE